MSPYDDTLDYFETGDYQADQMELERSSEIDDENEAIQDILNDKTE